ncbi:hypothetical protein SAMN05421640_3046 [Ekhidna lutea]|uniref:Uncharacterized protein n=1 Tax=Ekhidna lutea TaxID=447679 RepID=A0A239L7Q7_EKHLU|nr:hypothetical protein [Ekhidna lutea]SNT26646.1 hypothetical protein SAMN05421640_3046 [Ekhidna lutea]
MEETESMKFTEWVDSWTISDASNVFLMTTFTIVIIWLVVRTFRNKPSA